jgi:hypothetical protein
MSDQVDQQIEDTWLHVYGCTITAKLAPGCVNAVRAEAPNSMFCLSLQVLTAAELQVKDYCIFTHGELCSISAFTATGLKSNMCVIVEVQMEPSL